MKLSQNDMKRLRQALRARRTGDLKRAFALIRAHEDSVLLAALTRAPARPARRHLHLQRRTPEFRGGCARSTGSAQSRQAKEEIGLIAGSNV